MQFFGLAVGTPNDVAEISVELNTFSSFEIAVYPGGYDAGKDKALRETIYFHNGNEVADVLDKCAKLTAKINAMLAEGRAMKVQHLKAKAAEILKQAEEIERAGQEPVPM